MLGTTHNSNQSDLVGLILAGGKSERMGCDKGMLKYHGRTQRTWLSTLLGEFCRRVFVSIRPGQIVEPAEAIEVIVDELPYLNCGPMGALLSAIEHHPGHAWLVVSCDLPFLDRSTVKCLLTERNSLCLATAFVNSETGRPEPLVTIYEAEFMRGLPSAFSAGANSMMKILHASDNVKLVRNYDARWIKSADTPEEFQQAMSSLVTASAKPPDR